MIQQITSPMATHVEIVQEENDMTDFLDRLHQVLEKFRSSTFTCKGAFFKAKLIKRTDYTTQVSICEKYDFMTNNYVVSSKTKVMLEYKFTPLELNLSRIQFLSE